MILGQECLEVVEPQKTRHHAEIGARPNRAHRSNDGMVVVEKSDVAGTHADDVSRRWSERSWLDHSNDLSINGVRLKTTRTLVHAARQPRGAAPR